MGEIIKTIYRLMQNKYLLFEFASILLPTNTDRAADAQPISLDRTSLTKLSSLSFARPCRYYLELHIVGSLYPCLDLVTWYRLIYVYVLLDERHDLLGRVLDGGQRLHEHFTPAPARTCPPSISVLCGFFLRAEIRDNDFTGLYQGVCDTKDTKGAKRCWYRGIRD